MNTEINLKAHKLSNSQERKLLKLLKNAKMVGHGSSRLVFIDPRDSNRVVKVAIGANSFCQNKLEVKLWNSTQNSYLAQIYEYGKFVVVMERVFETYDEDSFYEAYDPDSEDYEFFQRGINVVNWLESELGSTSDNYQIGVNANDEWKAYDYGFDPEQSTYDQCGAARWMNTKDCRSFLDEMERLVRFHRPITEIQHFIYRQ